MVFLGLKSRSWIGLCWNVVGVLPRLITQKPKTICCGALLYFSLLFNFSNQPAHIHLFHNWVGKKHPALITVRILLKTGVYSILYSSWFCVWLYLRWHHNMFVSSDLIFHFGDTWFYHLWLKFLSKPFLSHINETIWYGLLNRQTSG